MPLFDNLHCVILKRQLEECDDAVIHKLGRNGATLHPGEFLLDKFYVLSGLNNSYLILSTLSLDGDNVVTTARVEPDIKLVDLDLSDAFHGCSEVVLQAVGGQNLKTCRLGGYSERLREGPAHRRAHRRESLPVWRRGC